MSPCSAKIAPASREERLPALAVAVAAEAGDAGAELAGALAERLHAPDVDLLELVEARGHALEVEHDVGVVLGDLGRAEQDRAVLGERAGVGEDPLGAVADRLACSPPQGPLEARRAARRRSSSSSWAACGRPAAWSSPIRPRSAHGSSPTSCRSSASGQQRERKPQPPHLRHADVLVRLLLARAGSARISSSGRERLVAALVLDVEDLPLAGVDLERHRRLAEGLLVEPAVGLELEPHVLLGGGRPAGSASSRGSRSRGGRGA